MECRWCKEFYDGQELVEDVCLACLVEDLEISEVDIEMKLYED